MNKSEIIQKVEKILADNGFTNNDYTISLQGPTVILTRTGHEKMTPVIVEAIKKTEISIFQLV